MLLLNHVYTLASWTERECNLYPIEPVGVTYPEDKSAVVTNRRAGPFTMKGTISKAFVRTRAGKMA